MLRKLRRLLNITVWTVVTVWLLIVVSLNIPAMKAYLGERLAAALERQTGAEVTIKRVDAGMMNRVIIDGASIKDLNGRTMLTAGRLSVKLLLSDLLQGKITIASAQIFGLKADLYKNDGEQANFLFLVDAFKRDETAESSPLNLRVNSLIIRRSEIKYNDSSGEYCGVISPKHVNVKDISAHIILNRLSSDSLNLNIRRLSLRDGSGLDIKRMSLKLVAGAAGARLSDFNIILPHSQLHVFATADYSLTRGDSTRIDNLKYSGTITETSILPSELHVIKGLKQLSDTPIDLSAEFNGTAKTFNISALELSQGDNFLLQASAETFEIDGQRSWKTNINRLKTNIDGIKSVMRSVGTEVSLPSFAERLQRLDLTGEASGTGNDLTIAARLQTDKGDITLLADKNGGAITAQAEADSISIAALTGNNDFGKCSLSIGFSGEAADRKLQSGNADITVRQFDFKGHAYRNAAISAAYSPEKDFDFALSLNDEYGDIDLKLACEGLTNDFLTRENISSPRIKIPQTACRISARHLQPQALCLTDRWKDASFSFDIEGSFRCNGIENAAGQLRASNVSKVSQDGTYNMKELAAAVESDALGNKKITCKSDFANILMEGNFLFATLPESFKAAIAAQLPALDLAASPAKPANKFDIYATLTSADFLYHILGIPLRLREPVHLIVKDDDNSSAISISADAKSFRYDGKNYGDVWLRVNTLQSNAPRRTLISGASASSLRANGGATTADDSGNTFKIALSAQADSNRVASSLAFDSNAKHHITGALNAQADLNGKTPEGKMIAEIDVLPSEILIADTAWAINPSHVTYFENHLKVDNFNITRGNQFININGSARKNTDDEILVSLKDVNVGYILDFVNFHSVDFDGDASGEVKVKSLFTKPALYGQFDVANFLFEGGAMGTAYLNMDYDFGVGSINIGAVVKEDQWRQTDVNGFVNLKQRNLDIKVGAYGSSLNFVQTYCGMFGEISNARGWGELDVTGPLGEVELLGSAVVTGDMKLLSTQVKYHFEKQKISFQPHDIVFPADTLTDKYGHKGVLTGHMPYEELDEISYSLKVKAANLLALDLADFGEDPYYGTVYATGTCSVSEIPGGTLISVDITPEANSFIMYNATAPDKVSDSFVHWRDKGDKSGVPEPSKTDNDDEEDMLQDIYINFLVRCDSRSELRILMDERMGDLVTLHGNGVINASFYNKGAFELYGNYVIDSGTYRMTIQDVIKRDFTFKRGGSISFGGDAFGSQLNLQANYTLNSVPLSDINIGKSFTNNNVRVDCLMNITGTPANPQIDFSLDMPTIGSDAKQMIMSMFNDNEELNQQVIYLIAVGRFLNQDTNSSSSQSARYSQTSLAMQSIISGTVSQQINSVLENLIGSKQWDFGANISTGEEGFNDAEYEGLVSGRMLNSRLLFNGQFGYRDNPNATSSFIGDFDLRYLLVPTGSMQVRIYNETNNRYFTKNTMTTQGVSLIIKKDFAGWRDFFRRTNKNKLISAPSTPTPAPSDTNSAASDTLTQPFSTPQPL